jgi:hypothetical protein
MIPTQRVKITEIMTKTAALKLLESNEELSTTVLEEIRVALGTTETAPAVAEEEEYETSTDDTYYYESSEAEYEGSAC